MAVVGLTLLVAYVAAAVLAGWVLAVLWRSRPDLGTTVLAVVVAAALFTALSYRYGTRQLLANVRATRVPRERAPALYDRLDELCAAMDIAVPDVYLAQMAAPNALALGGVGSGSLVLDASLFGLLTTAELDAVVAHELAHLESHDGLVQTVAFGLGQTLAGGLSVFLFPVALLATGLAKGWAWSAGRPDAWTENPFGRVRTALDGVTVVLVVLLALAIRAHSRGREFAADDRAVEVTGTPLALATALQTLERASEPDRSALSPLYVHTDENGRSITDWFATHPRVDERVERLRDRSERDGVVVSVE